MRLKGKNNDERRRESKQIVRAIKHVMLRLLRNGSEATFGTLCCASNAPKAYCERAIRELVESGEIERIGRGVYKRGPVIVKRPPTLVDYWESFCFGKAA